MGILDRISKSGKKVAVAEEKAAGKASGKAEQVAAKEATAAAKAAKKLKKLGKGLVGARGKKSSEAIKQLKELARAKISKAAGKAKYKVGPYDDIKGAAGLDAHHVGQKAAMKNLVKGYNKDTGPAINVPKVGHTIKGPNGIVSRSTKGITSARQLLARDIRELRRVYPDISNSRLKELIDMNKKLYPEMRK